MNEELHKLSQELIDIYGFLGSQETANGKSEKCKASNPHVELIDFDRLRSTLKAVAEKLRTIETGAKDEAVVRLWLMSRIKSLRRGRQAVLRRHSKADDMSSLESATLPALIRIFEEESARLRSTAAEYQPRAMCNENSGAEKYRPFKS
jgi:hypothetical protein